MDTLRSVETPEGVELVLRVAGPVPRALAWLIDALIKTAIFVFAAVVLGLLERFGDGLYLLVVFLVLWAYPLIFELSRHGATPGKRALRMRVVNDNGTPVDWRASLIRNLVRTVDWLPGTYLVGLVSILLTRDFKRVGDLAAGTVVIHDEAPAPPQVASNVTPRAPVTALSFAEQRAILAYGDRYSSLSEARARELAAIVGGYLAPDEETAARHLLATAHWLTGHK